MDQRVVSSAVKIGPVSVFSPLRNRVFAAILIANLVAGFGAMAQTVSASWLMMSLAPSADMIALVQTATLMPLMLFSIATGAVADVFDCRAVMLVAQIFLLAVSVMLVALFQLGLVTPWILLGATFLIGTGTSINQPAWQTSIGEQVPSNDLPSAVTLSSLTSQMARSAGPALGGAIVSAGGPALGFLINALSGLGLIGVLLWWRPTKTWHHPREHLATAIRSGVQYAARSPSMRAVIVRAAGFGLCASAIWGLMPLIARDLIAGGPISFGLLLGSFGLGSVVGGLQSSRIRYHLDTEMIVRLGSIGFALATILLAWTRSLVLAMPLMALAGGSWVTALSTLNVAVHASTPRWVVGRAFATFQMALFGSLAIGAWLWGVLAQHGGLPLALTLSGGALLGSLLLGRWWRIDAKLHGSKATGPLSTDPEVLVPINPESGPVTVMITYRIAPERTDGFLAAMAERRRIRRRDGARHWMLQQDVAQPEIWVERFDSPRWSEYLHYRTRLTADDHAAEAHVRSFHEGEASPVVSRLVARTEDDRTPNVKHYLQSLVEDPAIPPQH